MNKFQYDDLITKTDLATNIYSELLINITGYKKY